MKDAKPPSGEKGTASSTPSRKARKLALLAVAPVAVIVAGAAYWFSPAAADTSSHPAVSQTAPKTQPGQTPAQPRPQILDVPEMTVTLPNGGHARQLRIKLSLELTPGPHELPPPEQLNPQINDALLAYLRTLRDGDLDGGLALDRIRGDLYRRLTLVLGQNIVNNVLITSLVTG
jgi:flagellar FliL protein